jgi:hypothetical protein
VKAKVEEARRFIPPPTTTIAGGSYREGRDIALELLADALDMLAIQVERLDERR